MPILAFRWNYTRDTHLRYWFLMSYVVEKVKDWDLDSKLTLLRFSRTPQLDPWVQDKSGYLLPEVRSVIDLILLGPQ